MSLPTRLGVNIFTLISASAENPLTCSLRRPSGNHTQVTMTGTWFLAASATIGGTTYRSFCDDWNSYVTWLEGDDQWAVNYVIQGQYLSFEDNAVAPFSMSIPASSILTQRVFGLAAGEHRSRLNDDGILTSSVGCWSHWKSSYKDRSKWTRNYEPEAFYTDHESDDGTCYSIGRTSTATYADWSFEMEPKRKVYESERTGSDPYTWQNVIQDCRADKPFLFVTSSVVGGFANMEGRIGGIYRFRAESSFFKPRFRDPNYHNFISLDVKARVLSGGFV